jgi:hypothetical protein
VLTSETLYELALPADLPHRVRAVLADARAAGSGALRFDALMNAKGLPLFECALPRESVSEDLAPGHLALRRARRRGSAHIRAQTTERRDERARAQT